MLKNAITVLTALQLFLTTADAQLDRNAISHIKRCETTQQIRQVAQEWEQIAHITHAPQAEWISEYLHAFALFADSVEMTRLHIDALRESNDARYLQSLLLHGMEPVVYGKALLHLKKDIISSRKPSILFTLTVRMIKESIDDIRQRVHTINASGVKIPDCDSTWLFEYETSLNESIRIISSHF